MRRARVLRATAPDGGFTLVELLVTMALATVVLLALLGGFEAFTRTTKKTTGLAVSQESARATLREMASVLRESRLPDGESTPIAHTDTASGGDLVAASFVPDASGARVPGFIRYCVSADRRSLLVGTRVAASWGAAGSPGACARSTATDPAAGWTYRAAIDDGLRGEDSVFTYDVGTCPDGTGGVSAACPVRSIGIRLTLTEDRHDDAGITLSSAVSLRNAS
ncbi:PilW family protein [Patulibacter sp. S7RM1-6]